MFKLLLISIVLIDTANLTDVTYYEILGISKQASSQEIRQAYKKLAVKLHPDKNSNAEQEKFLKITEAYETLKDADKRRNYDLYGSQNSYTRKYDYHSQSEYNKLYYNGLYHDDPFVDTLSGGKFYNYLQEGFHFINFYSPFCPPCQNLVDHWKKLAERYKGIVKVAAVNCKHYNSFCYNSMRIGSYPSLLFYPNGKNGNFIYYRGDRTVEALDQFVMNYLKTQVHVPTVTQIRNTNQPIAYVLGVNRIESNSLTRIAYHLKGLVTLTIVEEHSLRTKLTTDEQTTVVFKYKGISKEIHETEEKDILKQIVDALPKIELIEPEKLKKIRNELRSGDETPWVLYFSSKNQDRLRLHQLSIAYPDMNFGEIDCDKWGHLCESLQVPTESTPAWGVLKAGGAYQRAPASLDIRAHLRTAASATRLHSLSASEFQRILDGGEGTWVLVVVPHQSAWDHIAEPFTRTGLHFSHNDDISFGIMTCTLSTDKHCRSVSPNGPAILMQRGAQRHAFSERVNEQSLIQFVELLRDSADLEITEQQVLEILDVSGREHSWLVAFLPDCGPPCTALLHECRKVAHKLKPLEFVRVGVLRCSRQSSGFCRNVRFPTMRLYPIASGHHYTVNLQNLAQAPYILEWALEYIDDSVQKLNWKVFSKTVIAEELHPKSDKKPWLVYFHSPRCYRCYEMFPDFAIAGILLNNAVNLGKVNCLNERGLCQHEQVTSYPSLKLYLGNNLRHKFSSVISLQVKDYASLLQQIKPHLMQYDERLLAGVDELGLRQGFHMKHDEF